MNYITPGNGILDRSKKIDYIEIDETKMKELEELLSKYEFPK